MRRVDPNYCHLLFPFLALFEFFDEQIKLQYNLFMNTNIQSINSKCTRLTFVKVAMETRTVKNKSYETSCLHDVTFTCNIL